MALIALITLANVVVRYLTAYSFAFTEEVSVALLVALALLGSAAAFGAGPRDSFMVGSVRKSGWPVWKIRTAIESSVALAAYWLGGPVGIGTVIIALTLGPAIQSAFSLMGRRAQDIRHEGLRL